MGIGSALLLVMGGVAPLVGAKPAIFDPAATTQATSQPGTFPARTKFMFAVQMRRFSELVGIWPWQQGQLWLRPTLEFPAELIVWPGVTASAETRAPGIYAATFNMPEQDIEFQWHFPKTATPATSPITKFMIAGYRTSYLPKGNEYVVAQTLTITPNQTTFILRIGPLEKTSKVVVQEFKYQAATLLELLVQEPHLRQEGVGPLLAAFAGPNWLASDSDQARLALLGNALTVEDTMALGDLVKKLDDDNLEIRDAATAALGAYGPQALEYLKSLAITNFSFEQRDRISRARAQLTKRFPAGATKSQPDNWLCAGALLLEDTTVVKAAAEYLSKHGGENVLHDFDPAAPLAKREAIFWQLVPVVAIPTRPATTQPQPTP
jgi:hypothetical protein